MMPHTTSRIVAALASVAAMTAPRSIGAQASPSTDASSDMSRMIGLSVAASGGPRDTLGLLIATVTRDGPADRAGITTGSRILAVNGLQVRLAPADIGRRSAADSALLKFDRALRVTPPGRDVTLRVAGGGLTRLVNVPVVDRRTGVTTGNAGVTVRTTQPAATPDVTAASDTNGERASSAAPTGVYAPTANPAPPPRPVVTTDPVAAAPIPATTTQTSVVAPPVSAAPTVIASPMSTAAAQPVRETRSVNALADALGDMQLEVRRLAHDSRSLAMSDSLADLDAAIGTLRRRMRAIAPEGAPAAPRTDSAPVRVTPVPPATASVSASPTATAPGAPVAMPTATATRVLSTAAPSRISVAGLELAKVSSELAAYLGLQADSGLSVIRASEAWEPIHTGDVVVQVDGAAPDPERLRSALETHRHTTVTLMRRGRSFTVLLGEADGH